MQIFFIGYFSFTSLNTDFELRIISLLLYSQPTYEYKYTLTSLKFSGRDLVKRNHKFIHAEKLDFFN